MTIQITTKEGGYFRREEILARNKNECIKRLRGRATAVKFSDGTIFDFILDKPMYKKLGFSPWR